MELLTTAHIDPSHHILGADGHGIYHGENGHHSGDFSHHGHDLVDGLGSTSAVDSFDLTAHHMDTSHHMMVLDQPATGGLLNLSASMLHASNNFIIGGHHADCDRAYNHSPVERGVCNTFESNHKLDDVRGCLINEKSHGVGFVGRHEDCFGKHFGGGGR